MATEANLNLETANFLAGNAVSAKRNDAARLLGLLGSGELPSPPPQSWKLQNTVFFQQLATRQTAGEKRLDRCPAPVSAARLRRTDPDNRACLARRVFAGDRAEGASLRSSRSETCFRLCLPTSRPLFLSMAPVSPPLKAGSAGWQPPAPQNCYRSMQPAAFRTRGYRTCSTFGLLMGSQPNCFVHRKAPSLASSPIVSGLPPTLRMSLCRAVTSWSGRTFDWWAIPACRTTGVWQTMRQPNGRNNGSGFRHSTTEPWAVSDIGRKTSAMPRPQSLLPRQNVASGDHFRKNPPMRFPRRPVRFGHRSKTRWPPAIAGCRSGGP